MLFGILSIMICVFTYTYRCNKMLFNTVQPPLLNTLRDTLSRLRQKQNKIVVWVKYNII